MGNGTLDRLLQVQVLCLQVVQGNSKRGRTFLPRHEPAVDEGRHDPFVGESLPRLSQLRAPTDSQTNSRITTIESNINEF